MVAGRLVNMKNTPTCYILHTYPCITVVVCKRIGHSISLRGNLLEHNVEGDMVLPSWPEVMLSNRYSYVLDTPLVTMYIFFSAFA